MAAPTGAHVLLEAVALVSHEGRQFIETRGGVALSDPHRCQQQKLLASGANASDATGDVECMAQGTRLDQRSGRVDESAGLPVTDKRVRPVIEPPGADPHAGWCGGWRLETSGYPIKSGKDLTRTISHSS